MQVVHIVFCLVNTSMNSVFWAQVIYPVLCGLRNFVSFGFQNHDCHSSVDRNIAPSVIYNTDECISLFKAHKDS